jgi:hypothetical protein
MGLRDGVLGVLALPAVLSTLRHLRGGVHPERAVATAPRCLMAGRLSAVSAARGAWVAVRLLRRVGLRSAQGDCLVRSLATFRLIRPSVERCEWIMGFRPSPDGAVGHAWVEVDGRPIPGAGDDQAPTIYRPMCRVPGDRRCPER